MSDELRLLREFRSEDGAVDAASAHAARAQLLTHIAEGGDGAARRGLRRLPSHRPRPRLSWSMIAAGVAVAVVLAVGALFLTVHRQPVHHHSRPVTHPHRHPSLVLPNLAPKRLPKLPGSFYCDVALSPPSAIPGLGGSESGKITVNTATVKGVNVTPFSFTAHGLPPTTRAHEYAVWALQVTGQGAAQQVVAGAKPQLFGVISDVGEDGRLAVEGTLPSGIHGSYIIRLTVQPRSSLTKPGRTVLKGDGQL